MAIAGASQSHKAYLAPFLAFMGLMALGQAVAHFFDGQAFWMVSAPTYWVAPLQTVVCGGLLARYWKDYELHFPQAISLHNGGRCARVSALDLPTGFLWPPPRVQGFDPAFFGEGGSHAINLGFRVLRLVVVVPLLEEIFWRGFLLRYLVREDFEQVAFGTFLQIFVCRRDRRILPGTSPARIGPRRS
jgi:CAAX prenyl protease-like protein